MPTHPFAGIAAFIGRHSVLVLESAPVRHAAIDTRSCRADLGGELSVLDAGAAHTLASILSPSYADGGHMDRPESRTVPASLCQRGLYRISASNYFQPSTRNASCR